MPFSEQQSNPNIQGRRLKETSWNTKILNRQVPFDGRVLILGCGAVARCTLPLIPKLVNVKWEDITLVDMVDNRSMIQEFLDKGVNYLFEAINRENVDEWLASHLKSGDFLVDLAWEIGTIGLLEFCRNNEVMYINASMEIWEPYQNVEEKHPTELTLYHRQVKLREHMAKWKDNKGATAVIDHGANPGLVSHLTKQGLEDIANKCIDEELVSPAVEHQLREDIARQDFASLAMHLDVKVIHISERDMQTTNLPKQPGEFVNTWSCRGLVEEGIAPAELGWGTHERKLPQGAFEHESGPRNQICLSSKGANTKVRSYVPAVGGKSGYDITGMVIRHGEAFTISDRLTVLDANGEAIYRPTVHYAYCPSDVAMNSIEELRMRHYDMQDSMRILGDDITHGADILGVLLMGHPLKSWWIGSQLDIVEARELIPHQNATTVQVAISIVAAMQWAIENPRRGVCVPDDLPHKPILRECVPYLGPVLSQAIDWTPAQGIAREQAFKYGKKAPVPTGDDVWQFESFLVDMEK